MPARKLLFDVRGLTYGLQNDFVTLPIDYMYLRAFDMSWENKRVIHPVAWQKSANFRGPDAGVPGARDASLKFALHLRASPGATPKVLTLMRYCGCNANQMSAKTGLITGGASNGTTITLLDANAGDIGIGEGIIYVPQSGSPMVRFVIARMSAGGTTTLGLNVPLPAQAQNGDSLLAAMTLTPRAMEPEKYLSFQAYIGDVNDAGVLRNTLRGCSGTWQLRAIEAGGLPVVEFDISADSYTEEEGTGLSMASAIDEENPARPILGDVCYYGNSTVDVKSLAFDPGMKLTALEATSGANGRSGWAFVGSEPKIEISPLHDITFQTDRDTQVRRSIMFQSLHGTTEGWGIWMPGAYVDTNAEENSDGVLRRKVSLIGGDPGYDDGTDTLYPRWAFVMAL